MCLTLTAEIFSEMSVTDKSSTKRIGGIPPEVRVSLRVYGEFLDPKLLTDGFGVTPSREYRRGDVISPRRIDALRPNGMWLLDSPLPPQASIDEQIQGILVQLPDSIGLWERLTDNYNRDLFCGVFVSQQISGISVSSRTLATIASRQLDLHIDLTVENDTEE